MTGFDYAQSLAQIKNKILDNFIFYETVISFRNMNDLYRLYFYETGTLVLDKKEVRVEFKKNTIVRGNMMN